MTPRPAFAVLAVAAAGLLLACGPDGRREASRQARAAREAESAATYQAEVEEGLGAAVAILIDTFPADSDLKTFWANNKVSASSTRVEKINVKGGPLPPPSGEETLDVVGGIVAL